MHKLLMITTIPETLNAFLKPFSHHFRAKGWQVDAMACGISHNADARQTFSQVWDVQWSRNPLSPKNLLVAPHTIFQTVEMEGYDIVHVHTPVAAFVARFALRTGLKKAKPQLIYTSHGFAFHNQGTWFKNAIFTALERIAGQWTDFLVVMNQEDYAAAKGKQLIAAERIYFMPGIGLDLQHYRLNTVSEHDILCVRQELNLDAEMPLLLSVAELSPRKRPFDILRAFAQLRRSDICLAFAGTGPLMTQLEQLSQELGIHHQVRWLGFRQDIPVLMRASIALILASEYEGLPRCVMEAMSLETPVIGSAVRGTEDLLANQAGLLFPVGDVTSLANAIAWVLDHPEAARQLGKKGRERMVKHDLKSVIELHEQLYAKALAQRKEDSR